MSLLQVDGISLSFGGLKAVSEFSLTIPEGELHGLIGPNGAGKTTVFNLLTGVYRPDTGTIKLAGQELQGQRAHVVACAGIARTFQNIRLFGDLSVLDNVRMAFHAKTKAHTLDALLRTPRWAREEAHITHRALELLALFKLEGRAHEQSRTLPYGDQRRLEIARALALEPRILLLDEPAAGMNPQEKVELRHLVDQLRKDFGLTILLIEHDMGVVMGLCEHITVLDHGVVIARGTPAEVQGNPAVIEAYLGSDEETH